MQAETDVFQRIFEQSQHGAVVRQGGRIVLANPCFADMVGYAVDELLRLSAEAAEALIHADDREMVAARRRAGQAGGRFEARFVRRDGAVGWCAATISPVIFDGQPAEVETYLDLTERKRAEAALNQANQRVRTLQAEIDTLQTQLREESVRDGLTGVFNRRFLDEILETELARARRRALPVSVVIMDLDLFRQVNDTFGHSAGDLVLRDLGTFLRNNTRAMDLVCRFGGDEFVVVMPGTQAADALRRAEDWREAFARHPFVFHAEPVTATLSLGVAAFPDNAQSVDGLLAAADKALIESKAGRNKATVAE